MRMLASIQTIIDIFPHNNADALEIAKVLGWTLCVLKGQFQKGQQIVFIEPDAILPEGKPEWEFMRARHFRIKTIRLRGVISQGLVFPLSILPSALSEVGTCLEGLDVTELLGITKYEPYVPAQLAGLAKGNFPSFLHKTDETRIQAEPKVLERHKDKKFYVTEKVDGSSMTVYLNNGVFGVCSRNIDLKEEGGTSYWKVARALRIEENMQGCGNYAVQGELVGQGIQGNKYVMSDLEYFVFNVFDIDKHEYLCYNNLMRFVAAMRLKTVPLIAEEYTLPQTVDELVEFSKGKSLLNKDVHREGIVLRPLVEERDEDLGRLSFKTINPDFLLKYDSD